MPSDGSCISSVYLVVLGVIYSGWWILYCVIDYSFLSSAVYIVFCFAFWVIVTASKGARVSHCVVFPCRLNFGCWSGRLCFRLNLVWVLCSSITLCGNAMYIHHEWSVSRPFSWVCCTFTGARPMDKTVRLGPLKISLRVTINLHGPSIHLGHYTASINCCEKHSIATIIQLRSLELLTANFLYCIYYTIWIDWHKIIGLEQEGWGLIAPMALAHSLHPIDNRSRNKRRNLWVGWWVSSWWPLFPSRSSVLIYIYICIYICSSIWVLFSLVYQLCLALWWW